MLNFKQMLVVNKEESTLVVAGPGSGKTHTITEKIKQEVEEGKDISKYLLLTFTNAAAMEILNRVSSKIKNIDEKNNFFGTYHSIFKKLMTNFKQFELFGLGYNPTIIMPNEQKRIFNKYLKEEIINQYKEEVINFIEYQYQIDGKKIENITEKKFTLKMLNSIIDVNEIFNIIESDINRMKMEDVKNIKNINTLNKILIKRFTKLSQLNKKIINRRYSNLNGFSEEGLKNIVIDCLIKLYEKKEEQHLITFIDILLMGLVSLVNFPDFKNKTQERFEKIFIDEFQDTNIIQFEIIKEIYNYEMHKICIIGDPYQSIYSFLGADISNILNVKNDLRMDLISLNMNYRSSSNIVDFTNYQLNYMQDKIEEVEPCISMNKEVNNYKIEIHKGFNKYKELRNYQQRNFLIKMLKQYKREGKTIGIITRSGKDIMTEKTLNDNKIEYLKRGGMSLKETKEIQVLSHLTMYLFSKVEKRISLEMILENTKGIGAKALEDFLSIGKESKTIKVTMSKLKEIYSINEVSKKLRQLEEFYLENIIPKISSTWKEDRMELAEERIEFILDELKAKEEESEIIEEIGNLILDRTKDKHKDSQIILSTIHSAKGLEWDVVFLMDWCIDSFERDNEEEAKRLNYVAISRAKEKLYILSDNNRIFSSYSNSLPYIEEIQH